MFKTGQPHRLHSSVDPGPGLQKRNWVLAKGLNMDKSNGHFHLKLTDGPLGDRVWWSGMWTWVWGGLQVILTLGVVPTLYPKAQHRDRDSQKERRIQTTYLYLSDRWRSWSVTLTDPHSHPCCRWYSVVLTDPQSHPRVQHSHCERENQFIPLLQGRW